MADPIPSTSDARTVNNSMRSTYRVLSDDEKMSIDAFKTFGETFVQMLHELGGTDPKGDRMASRDLSLSQTAIEDAVMRAVRHITK